MLVHNVYFWLKPDASPDDRAAFASEIKLLSNSPFIAEAFVGVSAPTEDRPVTDHSFDFSICFRFKTMADHNAYQNECKDHARFVSRCNDLWARVIVYDSSELN